MKKTNRLCSSLIELMCLLVPSSVSIQDALSFISESEKVKGRVRLCARTILSCLRSGYSFSSALSLSTGLSGTQSYIPIIRAGEEAGSISKILVFIHNRELRRSQEKNRIVSAASYPLFTIALSAAGTVMLYLFRSSFGIVCSPCEFLMRLVPGILVLVISAVIFALSARVCLGSHFCAELFGALEFLLNAGFDTERSLALCVLFCSDHEISVQAAASVRRNMMSGLSASRSFSMKPFPRDIQLYLQTAEKTGDLAGACRMISLQYQALQDKKREQFMHLIEPSMILAAGLYTALLIQNTVLPYLTSFGGII